MKETILNLWPSFKYNCEFAIIVSAILLLFVSIFIILCRNNIFSFSKMGKRICKFISNIPVLPIIIILAIVNFELFTNYFIRTTPNTYWLLVVLVALSNIPYAACAVYEEAIESEKNNSNNVNDKKDIGVEFIPLAIYHFIGLFIRSFGCSVVLAVLKSNDLITTCYYKYIQANNYEGLVTCILTIFFFVFVLYLFKKIIKEYVL